MPAQTPWWSVGYASETTAETARVSAIACAFGYIGMVVPIFTVAIPGRHAPLVWWAVIAMVVIGTAEFCIMVVDLRKLLGSRSEPPRVSRTLVQVLAATFAVGLFDLAIGGGRGNYLPVILLPVLVACSFGNRVFVAVVCSATMAELIGTTLGEGNTPATLGVRLVVYGAATVAVVGIMSELRESHIGANVRFDKLISTTDVILRSAGFDEALRYFLPLVASQAHAERVDACRVEDGSAVVIATWPDPHAPVQLEAGNLADLQPGFTVRRDRTDIVAIDSEGKPFLLAIHRSPAVWWRRTSYDIAVRQMAAEFGLLIHHNDYLARLDMLGKTDALTTLANRRELMARLDQETLRARRSGTPLTIAMIDIDHFKEYNDTYGHQEGDTALVLTGRLLRDRSRASDVIGRYGGEEFCVAFPDTDQRGAMTFLDKFVEHVRQLPTRRTITCSIGVAMLEGDQDSQSLIRVADEALYAAKRAGRDRIVLADEACTAAGRPGQDRDQVSAESQDTPGTDRDPPARPSTGIVAGMTGTTHL